VSDAIGVPLLAEKPAQPHREADRLNRKFGKDFRILKGIQMLTRSRSSTTCPGVSRWLGKEAWRPIAC